MKSHQLNGVICLVVLFLGGADRSGAVPEEESDAISIAKSQSERTITVRELNEFHSVILSRMLGELEKGSQLGVMLNVEHEGIIHDQGRNWSDGKDGKPAPFGGLIITGGARISGSIGSPLSWRIVNRHRVPLFSFWISKERTSETVGRCRIPSGEVHVNFEVTSMLDAKQEDLGKFTPRALLHMLEGEITENQIED